VRQEESFAVPFGSRMESENSGMKNGPMELTGRNRRLQGVPGVQAVHRLWSG